MNNIVRKVDYKDLCEGADLVGFVVSLNLNENDERVANAPNVEELSVKGKIDTDGSIKIDSELYYQTDDINDNIHLGIVSEEEKELIISWIENNIDAIKEAPILDTLSLDEFIEEYEIN